MMIMLPLQISQQKVKNLFQIINWFQKDLEVLLKSGKADTLMIAKDRLITDHLQQLLSPLNMLFLDKTHL